jgi:hypothetical protein
VEAAAGRRRGRRRHVAAHDRGGAAARRVERGHGREQRLRVGVLRRAEERLGLALLHDLSEVHDRHSIGEIAHHAEIVRDEEIGEAELLLEVAQQVQHLRLDRDVERRGGLVADEELRLDRERARDADALALAARELVRVADHEARVDLHARQKASHALGALGLVGADAVDLHALGHEVAHAHARVERGHRVLEHDLDPASQRAQRGTRQRQQVLALEEDAAGLRLDQPQQRAPDGRLAAARLADQRERAPGLDLEGDLVDRAHPGDRPLQQACAHREPGAEPLDPQDRRDVRACRRRAHEASSRATAWQRAR